MAETSIEKSARATGDVPPRPPAAAKTVARQEQAAGFWSFVGAHKPFVIAITIGATLRMIAMFGYRPAMFFNDSYDYLHAAMRPYPHPIRPDGYSFFLLLFKPFHSFALVAGVQHLMGLAIAVMIYALLRQRFALPGWGATLAAAPVLFDAYQIQLEHLILSDVPFTFLLIAVITMLLWRDRPSWQVGATAGLLLGLASLTRSIGIPVLLAVVVYLVVRRASWRTVGAVIALCVLPMAAYSGWFYAHYGTFAMTQSSGIFLYGRTMAFADCAKMNPRTELLPLCTEVPPDDRPISQAYIWKRDSTLHRMPTARFTEMQNYLAGDFASLAIKSQPLDYLRTMAGDFFRVFQWNRPVFPDRKTYEMYEFGMKSAEVPEWRMSRDATAASEAQAYEQGSPRTRIVSPWAGVIRGYQDIVYLRGTMLGVILLAGLAGLIPLWRRWGGVALLPWMTGVGLLLAPAATAEFDYRYVLPVVPLACIAAAIAGTCGSRRQIAGMIRRTPRAEPERKPEPARVGTAS